MSSSSSMTGPFVREAMKGLLLSVGLEVHASLPHMTA